MSVDQTFHTPSFGDEEFDLPSLAYAPAAAATRCSGQGVFGNSVPVEYLKRKLNCDQICVYFPRQEENYPDCNGHNQNNTHHHPTDNLIHHQQSNYLQQNHIMNNNQYPQSNQGMQNMYQGDMHQMSMQIQYDNHAAYTDNSLHQMQVPMMHQQHMMGPPQVYPTINQNQMNTQLGLQIRMASHQGASPSGSNHTSPGIESSEDSDDSTPLAQLMNAKKLMTPEPVDTAVPKVMKKPKPQKKKKKRDPNEPQKPVSAYALFFRDTQAAIKGQSPNASFGEVSKIVASMWDTLDVDRKNSYKKKTETAKKEYLKALAAYRANLVSKAAVDQSDSLYGTTSPPSNHHSPNSSPPVRMMAMQKPNSPVLTSVVDSMTSVVGNGMGVHPVQNQQVWHVQTSPHMATSPPHMMQPNNGMMGMAMQQHPQMSPQQHPQMSPQQHPQMSPQQHPQMSPQQHPQMSPQQHPQMSPQQHPQMSPQQHPQMGLMGRQVGGQQHPSPPMCSNSPNNSPSYNQNMNNVNAGGNHGTMGPDMVPSIPTCLRNGCPNPAIDSPDWDREYCSSECVVSHCKDVFAEWVSQRQAQPNPYSAVK